MKNINLNTVLPKLAAIFPITVITINTVINLYTSKEFTKSEYVWSIVGLVSSLYFGLFCKDLSK